MFLRIPAAIVSGVWEHFPTRAIEWLLSLIMVDWGLRLLGSGDVLGGSPAWLALVNSAQLWWPMFSADTVWGTVAFVGGAVGIGALTLNGTFAGTVYAKYSPHVRMAMALLRSFIWFEIVLSILGAPLSSGNSVYRWFLVFDLWCVFHTSADLANARAARKHSVNARDT
jgi:hypothetical protein